MDGLPLALSLEFACIKYIKVIFQSDYLEGSLILITDAL